MTTPKMEYRYLGRSGLKVSVISLGGWLTYGGYTENEGAFACMKAAYDAGVNFFDCAETYSKGESERVMGEAIKKFGWKRNDIVVSTKIYWGDDFGDVPVNNRGLSRKHIIEGLNASLKRLDLEYVDLVYAHRPDRDTPMQEIVRAFDYLVNTGKAFYWGTSEWEPEDLLEAYKVAEKFNLIPPLMEQPQYNLLVREKVEGKFARLYEPYGLGLTTFSPLKMGILTGKYNDGIPKDSRLATSKDDFIEMMNKRFGDENWKRDIELVKKLKPVADKLNCGQATLALAWVIKNPHVSSAITGASKVEQVYKNLEALNLVHKLTDDVMTEIDAILGNKPRPLVRRF